MVQIDSAIVLWVIIVSLCLAVKSSCIIDNTHTHSHYAYKHKLGKRTHAVLLVRWQCEEPQMGEVPFWSIRRQLLWLYHYHFNGCSIFPADGLRNEQDNTRGPEKFTAAAVSLGVQSGRWHFENAEQLMKTIRSLLINATRKKAHFYIVYRGCALLAILKFGYSWQSDTSINVMHGLLLGMSFPVLVYIMWAFM